MKISDFCFIPSSLLESEIDQDDDKKGKDALLVSSNRDFFYFFEGFNDAKSTETTVLTYKCGRVRAINLVSNSGGDNAMISILSTDGVVAYWSFKDFCKQVFGSTSSESSEGEESEEEQKSQETVLVPSGV